MSHVRHGATSALFHAGRLSLCSALRWQQGKKLHPLNTNLNLLHSAACQPSSNGSLKQWATNQMSYFFPRRSPSLQPQTVLVMKWRFDVHITPFIAFPSALQTKQDPLQGHEQWLFFSAFYCVSGVSGGLDWFLEQAMALTIGHFSLWLTVWQLAQMIRYKSQQRVQEDMIAVYSRPWYP